MEVHKYTDILGVALAQGITEGRMVLLTEYGARMPTSAAEAALSKYLVAWPVDNREMPIYDTYPSYTWALRFGFDRTANTPFSATVYTTYPGMQSDPSAVPSGTNALLYAQGEFTVTSGNWVYDSSVVAGTELEVEATAGGSDQGKLQKKASGTAVAVCTAVGSDESLRFRTYAE